MSTVSRVHARVLAPALLSPLTAPGADAQARAALVAGLSLDAMERALSLADVESVRCAGEGLEAMLAAVFGLAVASPSDFPAAALTRQMDAGDAADAVWMRADPVHVRTALAEASLVHHSGPAPGLTCSTAEAEALCALLNEALAEESLTLLAATAQRWYLRLDEVPDARFVSPYRIAGGSLRDCLPSGPRGGYWRRLMTVTQTVLHECPVNRAREAAGAPPINSLWFFGAGRLPARPAVSYTAVWDGHELCEALASHAGAALSPLPADAAAWLNAQPAPGEHLLYLPACGAAVAALDAGAWRCALQRFQDQWLDPLVVAVRDGVLASLRLVTDGGIGFRLTRASLRRFWRRRRSLPLIAAACAGRGA